MRYKTRLLRAPTANPAMIGDLCTVELEVTALSQDGAVEWTRIVQVRVTASAVRKLAEAAARNSSGKATAGGNHAKVMSTKGKPRGT